MSRDKREEGLAGLELPVVGRRRAIQGASVVALGGLAGVSAAAGTARLAAGSNEPTASGESLHERAPAPHATALVLGALATGARVTAGDGHRYALDTVFDVSHGGIPFVLLREDGVKVALEILRFDAARPAPGRNGGLAVHVPNRGDGATSTDESAGLAAMAVAAVLVPAHAPRALETLAERCARAPLGMFDVPA